MARVTMSEPGKVINKHSVGGASAGAAAVILATVAFLPAWEGTDYVAKRDVVGTGHPITWCHGQTNVDRDPDNQVRVGERFTKQECDAELAKSLPVYLDQIGPCLHRPLPVKMVASFLDAAYNAGSSRVCHSPMVAKANAGQFTASCNAFDGWIVSGDGHVLRGLIVRRAGELHGDSRKSERALCLEGAKDPNPEWYAYDAGMVVSTKPIPEPPKPEVKRSRWASIQDFIFKRR
jgi:lysozyme